ncbi:MAG: ferrous iron transport protein A [Spirochaetales bacterium]|nr:ferrous iron transport protein A [Spirochaetales bacterium]
MSLAQCEIAKTTRILKIEGGRGIKSKLSAMGLVPGMEIKVLRSHNRGPMIIEVMDSRIMLGHGMAAKIIVE